MADTTFMYLLSMINIGEETEEPDTTNIVISNDVNKLKQKAVDILKDSGWTNTEITWTPCLEDNQIHGDLNDEGYKMVIEALEVI